MSDPLSVAGTAVGITSLGIQVCQGLIQYLRVMRGRKEDIRDGIRDIEQVVSLLYSLNILLPRMNTETDMAPLRSCLNNCYGKLEALQDVLGEPDGSKHSSRVTRRAANAMRSVTYPFQQEKLTAIRQSLRYVLDDLNLIISIISLDSEATIKSTISTISLDLKDHASTHASEVSDLQIRIDSNFVQLRSLQSTIAGTLDNIAEQLHQTQLYIQDFDQRVDGKLTIIESGTQSIQDSSQVTAAKLEEMTQMLVSNTAMLKTMNIGMNSIQSLPDSNLVTAKQDGNSEEDFRKALHMRSPNTGLWEGCHCAASLPKLRTSFRIWNMRFQLEQQEHHLPSCKLWGTRRGMKRTARAIFPMKMACLSARMTVACFEYASGTSRPGLSIRCRNIVRQKDSPVHNAIYSFHRDTMNGCTIKQATLKMEKLERGILTLYTNGEASPGDIDEYGRTHAEIMFDIVAGVYPSMGLSIDDILHDSALTHTFISCVQTLVQACNSSQDLLRFSQTLALHQPNPDLFQQESINTAYLFTWLSQKDRFYFSMPVMLQVSKEEPSASFKALITEASELPLITRAILSRGLEALDSCVRQNSKSVLESIFHFNVLFLSAAWPEGLKYLMTTEAHTILDHYCYIYSDLKEQPIMRAIQLNQSHSVDILLEAGCCLDIDDSYCWQANSVSDQIHITIASHMAARRAQLLKIAQQKLGLYLNHASVGFADSVAARICAVLDASQISVHSSLLVDPSYSCIYHQGLISFNAFKYYWEMGFRCHQSYDSVGFTPIMRKQHRWKDFKYASNYNGLVETLYWLSEKGFMEEKATDPLKLGLNVSASGYHYLGALFAGYRLWYNHDPHFFSETHQLLSQASEDNCKCWCNAEGHSCSPTKLSLITHLHEGSEEGILKGYFLRRILHSELFDNVSGNDKISTFIMETLRLLTFEALEMTHTCCYFDEFDKHGPCGLIYERAEGDRGIFCHDPISVSNVRCCAIEQSRAALLGELMAEFTEKLLTMAPGPHAFESFIYTYWRRRISGFYEPVSDAVEGLLQYQTFQGFGAFNTVRTGVLPETLAHLLGLERQGTGSTVDGVNRMMNHSHMMDQSWTGKRKKKLV